LPENRLETSRAVIANNADLGLAWDGDFDRCFFFDEQGRFIESYYLIGLLARAMLARHSGSVILHDPRLTWNTREVVGNAGGAPLECKTGHAFMKARMRRENALYGGEMSGHHYFRDFGYCDSGMVVWLLVCALMSKDGRPLSALVDEAMRRYPVSGEINRSVKDAGAVMEAVRRRFEGVAREITLVDGLSMDMGDWRFNLRSSNTEPLLRLNVESRGDPDLMRSGRDAVLAFMD
jgi:phosphomannomutase